MPQITPEGYAMGGNSNDMSPEQRQRLVAKASDETGPGMPWDQSADRLPDAGSRSSGGGPGSGIRQGCDETNRADDAAAATAGPLGAWDW